VALQLVSPGSRGLYHRAIVQSADRATTRLTTHDQSLATGDAFAIAIGCTDPQQVVACMRSKTFNQVLTAMPVGTLQVVSPPNRVYWEPIVDGIVVLDQPRVLFEQGALERVPTIVGVNRDEGWGSFTSQFITQSFPTGVEANILFGNNYGPPIFPNHPLSGADESLHGAMSGYWTRFAATGNPNSDDGAAIHWPAFKHPTGRGRGSDKYLVLDTVIREGLRPREGLCDFFEPLFFRSILGALPAAAQ
jgi:carboxylesterase type B